MFTIRAGFSDQIELHAGIDAVREFFSDITNFGQLMPGVEQVHIDAKGIAHWKVQTDIPVVGKILQKFALEKAEDSEDRVEWSPLRNEAENLLRYSADFFEKAKNITLVQFSQVVEMRRKSARELHILAGMAGESLISNEMTKRVTEMINIFIGRAKERLER
ncbi:MAG TPA: SRPBCC family protein [Pyrinomonadaceae bacterium]|nr:SRPBCC family protein [Pyrinomonadaceae bacterium]